MSHIADGVRTSDGDVDDFAQQPLNHPPSHPHHACYRDLISPTSVSCPPIVSSSATPTTHTLVITLPLSLSLQTEFDTILRATPQSTLVVIDFHATWCGPCKVIAPTFLKLSNTLLHATFLKVDVDKVQAVAQKYSVRAMPTFVFLKAGVKIDEVCFPLARCRLLVPSFDSVCDPDLASLNHRARS